MAMEVRRVLMSPDGSSAHEGLILCIAYNPLRREIFTGSQDTTIKAWASETGELVRTLSEHQGWVTGLVYAVELKLLFSCSIDGRVLVWNKAECLQKERVGSGRAVDGSEVGAGLKGGPLHCLAWDARRQNLIIGASGHIWVYTALPDADAAPGARTVLRLQSLLRDAHGVGGTEDAFVRGIICTASGKLYSVGYDRRLCMWDTESTKLATGGAARIKAPSAPKLRRVGTPVTCHDSAISSVAYDQDNNWVCTGSYDRQVKIWASDGKKPVAVIDEKMGIDATISGLVYCVDTKT
jgi:WD40 repeat protein